MSRKHRSPGAEGHAPAGHATSSAPGKQPRSAGLVRQAKLTVGASADPLEAEADRAAVAAMSGQPAAISRGSARAGAQAKGDADGRDTGAVEELVGRGGGAALPEGNRAALERSFGQDLSAVRVHHDGASDAAARSIDAAAFATGNDVYLAGGMYRPGTPGGDALLAHEVAHTVQQDGGGDAVQRIAWEDVETMFSSGAAAMGAEAVGQAIAGAPPTRAAPGIAAGAIAGVAAPYQERTGNSWIDALRTPKPYGGPGGGPSSPLVLGMPGWGITPASSPDGNGNAANPGAMSGKGPGSAGGVPGFFAHLEHEDGARAAQQDPAIAAYLTAHKEELQMLAGGTGPYVYDDYSVVIDRLPPGLTPEIFLNLMATDINHMVSSEMFDTINVFSKRDRTHEPRIGDVYLIDLVGPDNGAVMITERTPDHWVFTALHTGKSGALPERGHRQFGFDRNPDGSVTFYTRGVSRAQDLMVRLVGRFPQSFGWTAAMRGVAAHVDSMGGKSRPGSFRAWRTTRDGPQFPVGKGA